MTLPPASPGSSRAPIFNIPLVIVAIVAVLAAIHVGRLALSDETDWQLLRQLAYVPARIWTVLDPAALAARLEPASSDPQVLQHAALGRLFVAGGGLKPWTLITYALLHASIAHLSVNMLWLVAFGAPVARRFGTLRFLAFIAMASIAGALAHTIVHPFDFEPVIGASAGVSGVVAAAVRFVFQPGESLGPSRDDAEPAGPSPPLPLSRLVRDRQAVSFLAIWFVLNFLFGVLAEPLGITDQAIAWEAHVGGFLAGLLLFSAFDPRPVAAARAT